MCHVMKLWYVTMYIWDVLAKDAYMQAQPTAVMSCPFMQWYARCSGVNWGFFGCVRENAGEYLRWVVFESVEPEYEDLQDMCMKCIIYWCLGAYLLLCAWYFSCHCEVGCDMFGEWKLHASSNGNNDLFAVCRSLLSLDNAREWRSFCGGLD